MSMPVPFERPSLAEHVTSTRGSGSRRREQLEDALSNRVLIVCRVEAARETVLVKLGRIMKGLDAISGAQRNHEPARNGGCQTAADQKTKAIGREERICLI